LRQENQRLKEEKEKLGYQLKQMLGKILEALKLSQILMSTVPSGVPPVVIGATVADGQKRFRNLLTSILTKVISAVVRLRPMRKVLMSMWSSGPGLQALSRTSSG
jgi:urease accessory protein UreF